MKRIKGKLNPKQQRFVDEYLVDLNATQAAARAGYSAKTAGAIGHELLKKPEIQSAISAGQSKLASKLKITPERVLLELARLAFVDTRKAYDADGNLKPIHELDDDTAAAIAGMEVEEASNGKGRVRKIRFWDKRGAISDLMKHLGLFVDRHEVTGKNGGPIALFPWDRFFAPASRHGEIDDRIKTVAESGTSERNGSGSTGH